MKCHNRTLCFSVRYECHDVNNDSGYLDIYSPTIKQSSPATRHDGTWGERRYSSYSFLTSALDGGDGQRHAPAALYPGERTPGTHWTGGWVGPRAGLDTEARGRIRCPCRGSNPYRPVVQSVSW
jgi:hypothetical protein